MVSLLRPPYTLYAEMPRDAGDIQLFKRFPDARRSMPNTPPLHALLPSYNLTHRRHCFALSGSSM